MVDSLHKGLAMRKAFASHDVSWNEACIHLPTDDTLHNNNVIITSKQWSYIRVT